jgi:hypothetical protein
MYIIQKKKFLEEFFEATCALKKALEDERFEDSQYYLDERERCIEEINKLDSQIGIDEMRKINKEALVSLLRNIMEKEQQVKQLMFEKKMQASNELKKINLIKKRNQSYQDEFRNTSAYFFDTTIGEKKI